MQKIIENFIQFLFVELSIIGCAWILVELGYEFMAKLALTSAAILAIIFFGALLLLGKDAFRK